MPKYVIERELPGAGKLTPQELKGISQKSCQVLRNLGPEIQWVQSFVTDDKIYCVYVAPNAEMIHEHAQRGGFPADRITEAAVRIGRTTSAVPGGVRPFASWIPPAICSLLWCYVASAARLPNATYR